MQRAAEGEAMVSRAGGVGVTRWRAMWVLALALSVGCARQGSPQPDASAGGARSQEALTVFAASSLSGVLPPLLSRWEAETGVEVRLAVDASSRLAPQVAEGAPADLLITADWGWMEWVEARGALLGLPVPLMGNRLVLIAGPGFPSGEVATGAAGGEWREEEVIRLLRTNPSGLLLAGENVPAGRYAEETLRALGLWSEIGPGVLRGGSVRSTLESVAQGAAPLGIVYRTDALAEPRVRRIWSFPDSLHSAIEYPGAVVAGSPQPERARLLLGVLASAASREHYSTAGFSVPGASGSMDEVEVASPVPAAGDPRAGSASGSPEGVPALPHPWEAILRSLLVAVLATLAGLPLAVAAGWVLARKNFPGRSVLSMAMLTPLVLPPVVTGFLMLSLLSPTAPLGRALEGLGVTVPFTLLGAVLAALVVGIPLYVASVRAAFESVDPHLEEVAWTLGTPPRRSFLKVTLPLALPGIAAGAILAFARALGEFGATVVLAGNVEGRTRTIALAVYTLLESPEGRQAIWLLVGASLALSAGALLGYEFLTRRQRGRMEWGR
jgi:molybdate transport system permease protein